MEESSQQCDLIASEKQRTINVDRSFAKFQTIEHQMARTLIKQVRKGDQVIIEILPEYFSTWDYSKIR